MRLLIYEIHKINKQKKVFFNSIDSNLLVRVDIYPDETLIDNGEVYDLLAWKYIDMYRVYQRNKIRCFKNQYEQDHTSKSVTNR